MQAWEQREPGAKKAFFLSLIAHSLLALMLTVGLNWRTSSTPAGVEVEIWDDTPPPPPVSQPIPEEKITPLEEPKAEIITHKKKEEPKLEKPKPEKKPVAPAVTFKPIEKPVEKHKEKEAPKVKESVKETAKETVKETPKEKREAKEQREAKAKAEAEKERLDRIEKLRAQASSDAGGTGGVVGSGVGSGGTDAPGFADKVRKFIRPKITFNAASVSGNPAVTVNVELAPDGRIIRQEVVRSSGVSDWDNAVLRALELAGYLPKDDNGSVPRQIRLIFRPKD
jgi:colicin import membrane protein